IFRSYTLPVSLTLSLSYASLFFFTAPSPTPIYTLSLHDALPISSVFGGSLFPAAVEAFAGSLAGAGAAGSGCWAWGFASLPSEGAVTFSAPLVVSAGPPGTTIATIPGPVPSIRDGFPPVRMSPPSSLSGDIVGVPDLAAAYNSCLGVVCTSAKGFKTSGSCFRGEFFSAVIHATAFGSGCGTGAFSAFSLSFAPGTSGESG